MKGLIPPSAFLEKQLQPLANATGLRALPLHAHEIAFAFLLYQIIFIYLAPWLSTRLAPQYYNHLTPRTALKWRVQCVSMVQSILICGLSFWVMANDQTRRQMSPQERVWSYSGAAGSIQAFATGYFLWDLVMTLQYLDQFGLPELIHALSCLAVYLLGFVRLIISPLRLFS
jgi:TLC domain